MFSFDGGTSENGSEMYFTAGLPNVTDARQYPVRIEVRTSLEKTPNTPGRAVAISVTGRFRDPEQFELLREKILPDVLADPGDVHVWSAGCATGLEVFGVSALLDEMGALGRAFLLGSDDAYFKRFGPP